MNMFLKVSLISCRNVAAGMKKIEIGKAPKVVTELMGRVW